MPRDPVPEHILALVDALIHDGHTMAAACKKIGVSVSAYKMHRPDIAKLAARRSRSDGARRAAVTRSENATRRAEVAGQPEVVVDDDLSGEAREALANFAVFRRRYFGRVSMPWQVEAAETIRAAVETPGKDYIVLNAPPGTGKSTLIHDLACWLIARNRRIRILMVSATGKLVRYYGRRVKGSLARTYVMVADDDDKQRGLSVDADATLPADFGRFQPLKGTWRDDEFLVEQGDTSGGDDKEPTFGAFGLDEENIGFRADVILTDDAFTLDNSRDGPIRDKALERWDKVVEKRLEPGGVAVVLGQRLGSMDGYRHCLDKKIMGPKGRQTPKYRHIVYKAHYDDHELCPGDDDNHAKVEPYPNGCLLDPKRLTYEECISLRHEDPVTWEVVYQQEDVAPGERLVEMVWVTGGPDDDGVVYPGCLDKMRHLGEPPDIAKGNRVVSMGVVDPSGTNYWAIEWRVFDADTNVHHLVNAWWTPLTAEGLLGWDITKGVHVGLMEQAQNESEATDFPITVWVVEQNAAQRYLLQHEFVNVWRTKHGVHLQPHTTHANKIDPKLGVQGIVPPAYRLGLTRLPYAAHRQRWVVDEKIAQLHEWKPDKRKRTDLVMTDWMALLWAERFAPTRRRNRARRPDWLVSRRLNGRTLVARG